MTAGLRKMYVPSLNHYQHVNLLSSLVIVLVIMLSTDEPGALELSACASTLLASAFTLSKYYCFLYPHQFKMGGSKATQSLL